MPYDLTACLLAAFFGGLLGFSLRRPARHDQTRLARLEAKVSLLLDELEIAHDTPIGEVQRLGAPNEIPTEDVRGHLKRGMKISAIKVYREQNPGIGLRAAKDAVEVMERQMKSGNY